MLYNSWIYYYIIMNYYEKTQLVNNITEKISKKIELISETIDKNNNNDIPDLFIKINKQQNDIENLSNKVDNIADKLAVLIDALTIIDQKISEKMK